MSELLTLLVHANLAAGLAILAIMALRPLARKHFGAQIAYGLWLVVPVAFLASLVPAGRAATETQAITMAAALAALLPSPLEGLRSYLETSELFALWVTGTAVTVSLVILAQMQFLRLARAGRAGPALVGVICPRIVIPTNYQALFTDQERALVRAHERAHMDRGDPKTNAAITLAQCLFWFNPLVHWAAHLARLDQELACDAQVVRTRPHQRRLYAETLLKTQLSATALPLGCHWISTGRHPLEARIAMLRQPLSSPRRRVFGELATFGLTAAVALGVWAAQPPAPPTSPQRFIPIAMRQSFEFEGHPSIIMIRLSPDEAAALPQPPKSAS